MRAAIQRFFMVFACLQLQGLAAGVVACLVACLSSPWPVAAQERAGKPNLPQVLQLPTVALQEATPELTILQGMPADFTVAQVARLAYATGSQSAVASTPQFERVDPTRLYPLSAANPAWLHLRFSAQSAVLASGASAAVVQTHVLEFPTFVTDRYEVFQSDAWGQTQMAAAGDRVAHSLWPVDSLRPRFPLLTGASKDAVQDVFVRVVHQMPLNFRPLVVQAEGAILRDSKQMLWTGLLLGVVFTLVLTCAQMSWAYRDLTYAWYAGYLFFTMMAALTYSGVAQRMLWPNATKFASDAIIVGVMLAFACNLLFTRAMFGASLGRVFHGLARFLVAACLAYTGVTLLNVAYAPLVPLFHALCLSVFAFILTSATLAWRKGVKFAGYWLMVYVPYLLSIAITLADSSGLFAAPWLASATPIVAAVVEAVAMMLCINAYSRLRHAQAVQAQVAAQHDPLTGFLTHTVFRAQAAAMWNAAMQKRRDVAIVYLLVEPAQPGAVDAANPMLAEAMMARAVRLVRTVTREFDVVGRLGSDRLGVVMADVPAGEPLNGRLTRLVALGLMRDSNDARDIAVKFTLCVGVRSLFKGDFAALDAALRVMALAPSVMPVKPIRYVGGVADHPTPAVVHLGATRGETVNSP